MDIEAVLDQLMAADVSIRLDAEGRLRIDTRAPVELKELVRAHKLGLIDVKKAVALMNATGTRIIRLPRGPYGLAYRAGADLDQIRWAMTVLRLDTMPLAPWDSTQPATEYSLAKVHQ